MTASHNCKTLGRLAWVRAWTRLAQYIPWLFSSLFFTSSWLQDGCQQISGWNPATKSLFSKMFISFIKPHLSMCRSFHQSLQPGAWDHSTSGKKLGSLTARGLILKKRERLPLRTWEVRTRVIHFGISSSLNLWENVP